MLAPANFGSALAILGKGTLSRLSSWFSGVEPGQGVLDWLCLGSGEAWDLNKDWIYIDDSMVNPSGLFPFVLTGQSIDRKLYDALNSYTGEIGSDGVVRAAAANLNATYIKLEQPLPVKNENGNLITADFKVGPNRTAPISPFRIIRDKSHSGKTKGIMFSVKDDDPESMETVNAIFDCINVKNKKDYLAVAEKFARETDTVLKDEKVEKEDVFLLSDRYFIHDRFTMIIFRVVDTEGYPITDFDLILTAGDENDPNHLPKGFFVDRQQNKSSKNTVTYFLNYDILCGDEDVFTPDGHKLLRAKDEGIKKLGIIIKARPEEGFVKYINCKYEASRDLFKKALNPNSTTMIEIVMQRVVDKEVFRMEPLTDEKNFSKIKPSGEITE